MWVYRAIGPNEEVSEDWMRAAWLFHMMGVGDNRVSVRVDDASVMPNIEEAFLRALHIITSGYLFCSFLFFLSTFYPYSTFLVFCLWLCVSTFYPYSTFLVFCLWLCVSTLLPLLHLSRLLSLALCLYPSTLTPPFSSSVSGFVSLPSSLTPPFSSSVSGFVSLPFYPYSTFLVFCLWLCVSTLLPLLHLSRLLSLALCLYLLPLLHLSRLLSLALCLYPSTLTPPFSSSVSGFVSLPSTLTPPFSSSVSGFVSLPFYPYSTFLVFCLWLCVSTLTPPFSSSVSGFVSLPFYPYSTFLVFCLWLCVSTLLPLLHLSRLLSLALCLYPSTLTPPFSSSVSGFVSLPFYPYSTFLVFCLWLCVSTFYPYSTFLVFCLWLCLSTLLPLLHLSRLLSLALCLYPSTLTPPFSSSVSGFVSLPFYPYSTFLVFCLWLCVSSLLALLHLSRLLSLALCLYLLPLLHLSRLLSLALCLYLLPLLHLSRLLSLALCLYLLPLLHLSRLLSLALCLYLLPFLHLSRLLSLALCLYLLPLLHLSRLLSLALCLYPSSLTPPFSSSVSGFVSLPF
ncbi:hypothetical protein RRG08_023385 [Elysia crispata]|uniref:Uncharacterized protein n=1 Tax=Elysia crispata TaxID=231223 RepID=A0AAE1EDN4_9GAST|nr:hypothetical protein RRG08_023385 [Elysia crispata]